MTTQEERNERKEASNSGKPVNCHFALSEGRYEPIQARLAISQCLFGGADEHVVDLICILNLVPFSIGQFTSEEGFDLRFFRLSINCFKRMPHHHPHSGPAGKEHAGPW